MHTAATAEWVLSGGSMPTDVMLYLVKLKANSREPSGRHDDVIKWKHFPRYWPFVWGIHRSPVNSPHKGQWRGALMFSLICVWINGWVNNREASDLRRYRAHYDFIVIGLGSVRVNSKRKSSTLWILVLWLFNSSLMKFYLFPIGLLIFSVQAIKHYTSILCD